MFSCASLVAPSWNVERRPYPPIACCIRDAEHGVAIYEAMTFIPRWLILSMFIGICVCRLFILSDEQ
jgi:hypothetical protein